MWPAKLVLLSLAVSVGHWFQIKHHLFHFEILQLSDWPFYIFMRFALFVVSRTTKRFAASHLRLVPGNNGGFQAGEPAVSKRERQEFTHGAGLEISDGGGSGAIGGFPSDQVF